MCKPISDPATAASPECDSPTWWTSSRASPAANTRQNPPAASRTSLPHSPARTAAARRNESTTATMLSASDSVLTPRIFAPASPWADSTCFGSGFVPSVGFAPSPPVSTCFPPEAVSAGLAAAAS